MARRTKPLRDQAIFERRSNEQDGFGNYIGEWVPAFTRWCSVNALRGGESVIASRLQGRQPVIVTVRNDPDTDTIEPEMRATIDGRTYNIREMPRLTEDRLYLEFLAESGVSDG